MDLMKLDCIRELLFLPCQQLLKDELIYQIKVIVKQTGETMKRI